MDFPFPGAASEKNSGIFRKGKLVDHNRRTILNSFPSYTSYCMFGRLNTRNLPGRKTGFILTQVFPE